MQNKLMISLLSLALLFSLGVTSVKAEDDDNSTTTPEVSAVSDNQVDGRPIPVKAQIERRETIKETYKNKVEELRNKYQEQKDIVKSTTTQNFEERREMLKEKAQEKRELVKERLNEQRRSRVQAQNEKVGANFEKTIERIESLVAKVQERIDSMAERGIDMTKSNEVMTLVPGAIQNAKDAIEAMKIGLEEILDSDNPEETYGQARELANTAKETVKSAHKSLVDVIVSMKASVRISPPRVEDTDNQDEENNDEGESDDTATTTDQTATATDNS